MKVILSVDPVRFPLTGIGRYAWELGRHLEFNQELTHLKFFAGRNFLRALPAASDRPSTNHFARRLIQKSQLASDAYQLVMPMLQKNALKKYEDHIFHGPNFFIPPFQGKKVATFHDLSPFTWTQCYTPQRVRYTQRELLKTIQSADALITDSAYTREELARYFSWPLDRIHVVPLASADIFCPRTESETEVVLKRYDLRAKNYTLFVGTIEPRKNIEALLSAYEKLPEYLKQKYPLVLSGYQGWRSETIHKRIKLAERQGWARYIGYSPAEDLPQLFSGARVFAFPSHYEGFGLPVLEAMASGVPVVCSDSSSLPEVVGSCALLSAPHDVDMLSENLRRALEDDFWRVAAVAAGLERAALFSWDKCAANTVAVYRSIAS